MKKIVFLSIVAFVFACKPIETNPDILTEESPMPDQSTEIEISETPEKNYQASESLLTDLINTKLEVSFQWDKSRLIGKETLTAKPHFYSQNELILDAKGMQIVGVKLGGKELVFDYNNDVLKIKLDRTYSKSEEYTVTIDYVAMPNERTTGGSAAITSDKGLYFINPEGKEPNKMPQIWTQGETEASSVWFPTIDAPNVKTKQEIYITVDEKYTTLSNGKLVSSIKNAGGTRTDYWKQELPHAPYLFMMSVGEFKIVKDTYTRPDGSKMDVNYYVEPEYESNAKAIFGETPSMIAHFSKLLGYEFPWDKYNQIVVREYVSGAMENTGAVIFGDYVYKNDRELLDGDDNSTIAHELFHHWFGDLVTCESWSNLTVNESFANYSQYLWDEHRYGLDEADYQAVQETNGYFGSALNGGYHNLVWFDYDSQEQMFDGHTYNKGGRILHMLRNYIGDEAFFLGIKNYLKNNQFKAAEFHHLRLEWEAITGEDLNWFFNQWYLGKGHPDLEVTFTDNMKDEVSLLVNQTQTQFSTFDLPIQVAIYDQRGITIEKIRINKSNQLFTFKTVGKVENVVFDQQAMLLAKVKEEKPGDWYQFQYYNSKRYIHRLRGVKNALLGATSNGEKLILDALKDEFWDIRIEAIDKIGRLSPEKKLEAIVSLKELIKNDPKSQVREAAVIALSGMITKTEMQPILESTITSDKSYLVVGSALSELIKIDKSKGLSIAKSLENENSSSLLSQIAVIYSSSGDLTYKPFVKTLLQGNKLKGQDVFGGMNAYAVLSLQNGASEIVESVDLFSELYFTKGAYAQMFVPQVFDYYLENAAESKITLKKTIAQNEKEGKDNTALQQELSLFQKLEGDIAEFKTKAKLTE